MEFLLASDVALCGLRRSVAKEKLNLFRFAFTTMAQARASAAKIVRRQVAYAGLPGASHRLPDYVGCHPSFLSRYDKMASLLAPYGNSNASAVARDLDSKVETLLRESAL